jgi:hypothetical protein
VFCQQEWKRERYGQESAYIEIGPGSRENLQCSPRVCWLHSPYTRLYDDSETRRAEESQASCRAARGKAAGARDPARLIVRGEMDDVANTAVAKKGEGGKETSRLVRVVI